MKIAIIQENIDPRRGGAETSTLEMAAALAALGAAVTIVTASAPDGLAATAGNDAGSAVAGGFVERPVSIRQLAVSGRSRSGRTRRFLQAAAKLGALHEFDIVHAISPCDGADVYQPRGGTYLETMQRSHAHIRSQAVRMLRGAGRWFNRRQRLLADAERRLLTGSNPPIVAALSQYVARCVQAQYGVWAEQIRVVFNGVDVGRIGRAADPTMRFERRALLGLCNLPRGQAAEPLLLFVAHNFRLKGLRELLSALARLRKARWRLVVAGRDRRARFERQAAAAGIAERVEFVGGDVPIVELYAAADLLVHPTWYDPCSRVVLEALAAGLPVVTTGWNGAAELIECGRNGVVIDRPDDSEALAHAIVAALKSEVAQRCRDDAPAVREQVSMQRHARELLSLYESLMPRRAQAAAAAGIRCSPRGRGSG